MVDIARLHRRALEETHTVVAGVGRDQWDAKSPCDSWDVQALLNHLVSGNLWAVELGAGATIEEVGDRLDGDVLEDDALVAYDSSAASAAATSRRPALSIRRVPSPMGLYLAPRTQATDSSTS